MTKMNIKKGDKVKVLTGKDRGAEGVVLSARPSEQRVVVEKVMSLRRHFVLLQATHRVVFQALRLPIHVSNVQLLSILQKAISCKY